MTNLLKAIDPAAVIAARTELDARAEADLHQVSQTRPGAQRTLRTRRPWYVTAGAAAAVTGILVTLGTVNRPSPAAADPVALSVLRVMGPADTSLAGLASVAETAPTPTSTVSYAAWDLNARIEGKLTNTAIVVTRHERTPDDGGIRVRVTVEDVQYPTAASKDAWSHDAPVAIGDVIEDRRVASTDGMYDGIPAPSRPDTLARFLAQGHPIGQYGPGELFVAVTDLAQEQNLTGAQTAALLRLLDRTAGVTSLGMVTDRAGRPGIAFAAEGDFTGLPTRYVLIFDPATGRLRASERWLTTTSGALGIPVPASIGYRQFNG